MKHAKRIHINVPRSLFKAAFTLNISENSLAEWEGSTLYNDIIKLKNIKFVCID